jgi:hypothetical protein
MARALRAVDQRSRRAGDMKLCGSQTATALRFDADGRALLARHELAHRDDLEGSVR